jgi:hypothetical protein
MRRSKLACGFVVRFDGAVKTAYLLPQGLIACFSFA